MENDKKFNMERYILAIPVIGGVLMVLAWQLSYANSGFYQNLLIVAVLLSTIILIVMEASKNKTVQDGQRKMSPPTMWVFYLLLLWALAYPTYMYRRKNIGLPNRLWAALGVCPLYLSCSVISSMPNEKPLIGGNVDMALVFPDGAWSEKQRELAAKGTVMQLLYYADGVKDGLYRGDTTGFGEVVGKSATIALAWARQENMSREQRACQGAAAYMAQAAHEQSMYAYELFTRNLDACKLAY